MLINFVCQFSAKSSTSFTFFPKVKDSNRVHLYIGKFTYEYLVIDMAKLLLVTKKVT